MKVLELSLGAADDGADRITADLERAHIVTINDVPIGRGGATGLALRAAEGLAARGRRVTFLSADPTPNPDLAAAGVAHCALGGTHILRAGRGAAMVKGLHNEATARRLAGWIDRHDTGRTVYHLHGWSKIFSPAVMRVLRPVFPRVVIHAHDYFLGCPNGAFWDFQARAVCLRAPLSASCLVTQCDRRSGLQKLWRAARTGLLWQHLDRGAISPEILLIHPAMAEPLLRSGFAAERLTVLRNPAVPFSPRPIAAETNSKVAFVGRLDSEKGGLFLARAAAKAGIGLMVMGEGPEEEAIAATGAEMHGWCDRARIGEILQEARALVMPSQYPEPFGLVAVEALGSGLPVIAARSALLASEIAAAGAGFAFDATDEAALIRCLSQIAREDDAIARASARALAIAGTIGLSHEAWLDGLEAAYGRALVRGGRHHDAA